MKTIDVNLKNNSHTIFIEQNISSKLSDIIMEIIALLYVRKQISSGIEVSRLLFKDNIDRLFKFTILSGIISILLLSKFKYSKLLRFSM